jgi:ribonuclease J
MQGAKVIYGRDKGIHVSGHGAQEDQKMMIALTRPKFFLPVHGEHRMLVKHSETAQSMGIPAENMVIIDNGDVVELTPNSIRVSEKVPSGIELVDASRSGIVQDRVLKERQKLAEEGIVTVAAAISPTGELLAKPEVHLRGVVTSIEKARLDKAVLSSIETIVKNGWSEIAQTINGKVVDVNWVKLQADIEAELRRMMRRELQSSPTLVFLMQTSVPQAIPAATPQAAPAPAQTGVRRQRSTAKVAS